MAACNASAACVCTIAEERRRITGEEFNQKQPLMYCDSCEQLSQFLIPSYIHHDNQTKSMTYTPLTAANPHICNQDGRVINVASLVVVAIDTLLEMDDQQFFEFLQRGCCRSHVRGYDDIHVRKGKGKMIEGTSGRHDNNGKSSIEGLNMITQIAQLIDAFLQRRKRYYDYDCDDEHMFENISSCDPSRDKEDNELEIKMLAFIYKLSSRLDIVSSHGIELLNTTNLLDIASLYGTHNRQIVSTIFARVSALDTPSFHQEIRRTGFFIAQLRDVIEDTLHSCHVLEQQQQQYPGKMRLETDETLPFNDIVTSIHFLTDACITVHAVCCCYNQAAALMITLDDDKNLREDNSGMVPRESLDIFESLRMLHDELIPTILSLLQTSSIQHQYRTSVLSMLQKLWGSSLSTLWAFFYHGLLMQPLEVSSTNSGDQFVSALMILYKSRSGNDSKTRTAIEIICRKYNVLSVLQERVSSGHIFIEEYQMHYIQEMIDEIKSVNPVRPTGIKDDDKHDESVHINDNEPLQILSSVLPDYGVGFLSLCLNAFNGDSELTISCILENSLPDELVNVDTQLTLSEAQILINSAPPESSLLKEKPRKNTNNDRQEQVEKWCTEKSESNRHHKAADWRSSSLLDSSREQSAVIRRFAIESQYEYDDEYDDSLDDLPVSIMSANNDAEGISNDQRGTSSSKELQDFYLVDGKLYNYKKSGSELIRATDIETAQKIVKEREIDESDKIYGLGFGGNKGKSGNKPVENDVSSVSIASKDSSKYKHTWKRGNSARAGGAKNSQRSQGNQQAHTDKVRNGNNHDHKGAKRDKDKRKVNVSGSKFVSDY